MGKNIVGYIMVSFTILVSLTACSQKKETIVINQNPDIAPANLVNELVKRVKHYPKELKYILSYTNNNCFFEVLVNDILVYKEFVDQGNSGFDINQAIFKNGQQKVTYRMYPIGKAEPMGSDSLEDDSYLELALESYDNQRIGKGTGITHIKFRTPETTITKKDEMSPVKEFDGSGKTYYEGSFTISVDVPYQINCPFANARDLRKVDQKQLEAKLLQKYREMKNIYQNKEYDNIAKLSFDNFNVQFTSQYEKEETINTIWKEIIDNVKLPSFQMQPIENYKLQFYADGRLVSLMQNTTDKERRGNSVLWAKFSTAETEGTFFSNDCYYIPQGETEFKVY